LCERSLAVSVVVYARVPDVLNPEVPDVLNPVGVPWWMSRFAGKATLSLASSGCRVAT
jgi:hypothetical protein